MASYYAHSDIHSRTAGAHNGQHKSVQAWKTRKTAEPAAIQQAQKTLEDPQAQTASTTQIDKTTPAQKTILANLEKAADGKIGSFDLELQTSNAYAEANGAIDYKTDYNAPSKTEGYQFEDVVDVVNPLHHLPIVGMVYRGLTNDTIHPMSQIIGGAIYGGPVGAVTGTANAISQIQTGKDLGDHAMSLVGLGSKKSQATNFNGNLHPAMISSFTGDTNGQNKPLNILNDAVEINDSAQDDLGSAMSFVNLSEPNRAYKKVNMADGRTAGSMIVEKKMANYRQTITNTALSQEPMNLDIKSLPQREAITNIQLSAMPPRRGT